MDYYRILGVEKNASREEIKSAYRDFAKKYHPDINQDKNATYLFMKIKEAYDTLIDDHKRRDYDDQIGHKYAYSKYSHANDSTGKEPPEEGSYDENSSNEGCEQNDYGDAVNKTHNKSMLTGLAIGSLAIIAILALLLVIMTSDNLNNDSSYIEAAPVNEGMISIEVVNKTEDIVLSFAVFFGQELDEWGEDMLGEEVIEPGEVYTFILPEGTYDLSLLTYELYVIDGVWNINDNTRIIVGGESLIPVLVQNDSESDIGLFFLAPSESEEWGEDWLGDYGYIPSEIGRRFFFVKPGVYDLLAIDLDGERVLEVYELVINDKRTLIIE
jgi:hypothetical protein